jgi:hypothetical protein
LIQTARSASSISSASFGHDDRDFTWERASKADALRRPAGSSSRAIPIVVSFGAGRC